MFRTRLSALVPTVLHTTRMLLGLALVWSASSNFALSRGVPEIDPGSATSALTLLAGGVLLLMPTKRRK
jgi:hypothetical protein